MSAVDTSHAQALRHYQAGEYRQAEELCRDILQRSPLHCDTIYLLGALALEAGRPAEAIRLFHHLTLQEPGQVLFRHALGEAFRSWGGQAEAAQCYREALKLDPACARAHHGLGLSLMEQGEVDQAVASFRQSLALEPNQARAHANLALALHRQGDLEGAAACCAEAIRLKPDYAIPHNQLGAIRQAQGQLDAAITHFRQALRSQPDYAEAHFNLGSVLFGQGDAVAAAASLHAAIGLRPGYARAHHRLGEVLEALCDFHAALASYREAVRLQPDYAEAHQSLGNLLLLQPDWDGARAAFERVLELQPDNADAFARLFFTRQVQCDWRGGAADVTRLWDDASRRLAAGRPTPVQPFCALTVPWSAERQLAVARSHADASAASVAALRQTLAFVEPPARPEGRLRIGYLSGEFRDHAVSHLIQGVFGLHDRRGFEVFAYSFGPDDGSSYRQRISRECDHFRDLRESSLAESAQRIHADGVQVLVDLQGHIGYSRMALLALRPAPVQVHYLGHPGTTGADFIDYLIGDPIVTPPESHAAYREQLVLLPHCYLATDNAQPIADSAGTRADHGLPESGFVFCAFNHSYKIEPDTFTHWMRIVERVPGSVLWLSPAAAGIERNLRREAESRGVAGDRLVFARRLPGKAEHLARHRLADLYLDTATYNGHTTAVDALWAGLPVLTCPGATFASRVAASLLVNIGLPELVMPDREEYVRQAVRLATDSSELQRLRRKLADNRSACPLFDTPRLTRNLERAYRAMWENFAAGRPPCLIRVVEPCEKWPGSRESRSVVEVSSPSG